jgi:hypothetical protein
MVLICLSSVMIRKLINISCAYLSSMYSLVKYVFKILFIYKLNFSEDRRGGICQ